MDGDWIPIDCLIAQLREECPCLTLFVGSDGHVHGRMPPGERLSDHAKGLALEIQARSDSADWLRNEPDVIRLSGVSPESREFRAVSRAIREGEATLVGKVAYSVKTDAVTIAYRPNAHGFCLEDYADA